MYQQFLFLAAVLAFWDLSTASGQEENLYTPQPEHKLLERFVGEWKFERMSATDDGSKPESLGSGDLHGELLGGFFVVCRWTGQLYGGDYKAVQTLGYDVDKSVYAGTWVDSIMSYQWQLNGLVNTDRKELIVEASGPGPNGDKMKFREINQFNSADSITIIAQMQMDEKWTTFMTTQLTRKKTTTSDSPGN